MTLSLTINKTLNRLSSLPILIQESFWWWQCSDRYTVYLSSHLHTPSPFSPSLISLMISVEVKYHVYQRASNRKATDLLRSLQSRYHVTFLSCLTGEDFLNYNRGMDREFSCFLDDMKVSEPSEEVDSTVEMTVRCYRWRGRTKLHIEFPVWVGHYSRQKIPENPTPRTVYLKMTQGVDWHPKNQNKC